MSTLLFSPLLASLLCLLISFLSTSSSVAAGRHVGVIHKNVGHQPQNLAKSLNTRTVVEQTKDDIPLSQVLLASNGTFSKNGTLSSNDDQNKTEVKAEQRTRQMINKNIHDEGDQVVNRHERQDSSNHKQSKSNNKFMRETVTWRVPKKKKGVPDTGFNLDYAPPKVHPPTHN